MKRRKRLAQILQGGADGIRKDVYKRFLRYGLKCPYESSTGIPGWCKGRNDTQAASSDTCLQCKMEWMEQNEE